MNPLLNIAGNALGTTMTEMSVDTQNTTNAATPGYQSESVAVSPLAYQTQQDGVAAGKIVQSSDPIDAHALLSARSSAEFWATQASATNSLQSAFSEPQTGGIQETLNALAKAWANYQSSPTSQSDATNVISQATNAAQVLNSLNAMITKNESGTMSGIQSQAHKIPSLLSQIATLNHTINDATPGSAQAANAVDQLNQSLSHLASVVPISVIRETNGSVIVNSQKVTLVAGTQLPMAPSWRVGDPPPSALVSVNSGPPPSLNLNGVTWAPAGGSLGGMLAAASTTNSWQTSLKGIMAGLASTPANSTTPLFRYSGGKLAVSASVAQLDSRQAPTAQKDIQKAVNRWSSLVGQVGSAGQLASNQSSAAKSHMTSVQQNFESQTSVNTNQSAANLIQEQQAYSAAAQVMNIAQQTTSALLAVVQ